MTVFVPTTLWPLRELPHRRRRRGRARRGRSRIALTVKLHAAASAGRGTASSPPLIDDREQGQQQADHDDERPAAEVQPPLLVVRLDEDEVLAFGQCHSRRMPPSPKDSRPAVSGVRDSVSSEQVHEARRRAMKVIYTYTDEAPALATHSLLPVIEAFAAAAGFEVETRDISLAGRILAAFGLVPDALAELGAAGHHPRGQHHQAAERQRVDPAAQGGDRGAEGGGPRGARLPGEPADRREIAARAAYDAREGQRGQPGAARGQLRSARARVGQAVRPQPPAFDGRVVTRLRLARHDHVATATSAIPRRPSPPMRQPRCASSTSPPTARSPCSSRRCRCSKARSSTPR